MRTELRLRGCPNQLFVMVEHGEHHMGAETTEFQLPFEIGGADQLFMTNGRMFEALDGVSLLIHDATLLLKIDCRTRLVQHLLPPDGCYFRDIREYENGMGFEFYGCSRPPRVVPYEDVEFRAGAGPLSEGLAPTAFKPHVDAVLKRRRNT